MNSTLLLFIFIINSLIYFSSSYKYNNNFKYKAYNELSTLERFPRLYGALNEPPLELCDENMLIVMNEVKEELGTIFGYDRASRDVGITGEIELIEIEGPTITVALKGRFWHATDTVMMRVESFIRNRVPEVVEVVLDLSKSNIIDDNRLNTDGGKKLF